MTKDISESAGGDYTKDEAISIINRTIDRKTGEIEAFTKKLPRLRNKERIEATKELISFLQADVDSYKLVLADMTGDPSRAEGVDPDAEPAQTPSSYNDYIEGLDKEALDDELAAESIRADYCDAVLRDICIGIGEGALESKKMIRAMLDDPFALEQIGQVIFSDEYLHDLFKSIVAETAKKKKKKKKKV